MGGGSSVMGMVAYRGTPDDYAEWQSLGAVGWGWDDVLPYYRKLENDLDFDGALHGKDGPVPIRRTKAADWAPLAKAVHAYAEERQIPFVADMNADFRDGYGSVPMSNTWEKRRSASICYLTADVRRRSNLTVITRATVTGLVFDGRRASGVTATVNGARQEFSGREIIISLGGIHSPAFLMRAGIGPAAALRALGIEVRADKPGVGENLSNHAILFIGLLQKRGMRQAAKIRPHPMTCFRYSSNLPGAPPLDMYLNVQCKTSWSPLGHQVANLAPSLLKPMARGRVALTAADPATYPLVEFNFTGHELDLKRFMQGFRRCVDILAHDTVRAMTRLTFPVKFNDRLRRLNRITPGNKIKSALVAALIDAVPPLAEPIFATLADRRVDLASPRRGRRSAGRSYPRQRRRHLPSGRHLPHGRAGRSQRGDRSGRPRSRCRRLARHRRFHHADHSARQHQYSDHHGGGKARRRNVKRDVGRFPGGGLRRVVR